MQDISRRTPTTYYSIILLFGIVNNPKSVLCLMGFGVSRGWVLHEKDTYCNTLYETGRKRDKRILLGITRIARYSAET